MKVDFNTSKIVQNPVFRGESQPNSNVVVLPKQDETLDRAKCDIAKPSLKNGIAGIWKGLVTANQMINATLKGLFYGAVTGIALLGGSWLFKSLPKALSKEGPTLLQTLRHPLETMSKSGKIIAGVGSALVLTYQLIAGKLNTNQKTADIDHKLKTGHREK